MRPSCYQKKECFYFCDSFNFKGGDIDEFVEMKLS